MRVFAGLALTTERSGQKNIAAFSRRSHPHVHVSVTLGGVNSHGDWKALSYCHEKVEQRWRHGLCDLLLSEYDSLNIDDSDTHCRDFDEFRRFINAQRPYLAE